MRFRKAVIRSSANICWSSSESVFISSLNASISLFSRFSRWEDAHIFFIHYFSVLVLFGC